MGIQGGGQHGGLTDGGGGGAAKRVCAAATTKKNNIVKAKRFIFNRMTVNIRLKNLNTKTIYLLKSTIFVASKAIRGN
jgi:hypothetical protein